MQTEFVQLMSPAPGSQIGFPVHRFGTPGARPKAYIQAALHADEVPAMLVAQRLNTLLQQAEAQGRLVGEVVLVPSANPIGLTQLLVGLHQGRFDIRDGGNFNRGYPDLFEKVADAVGPLLDDDAAANTRRIQSALRTAAAQETAGNTTRDLKNRLLAMAADADIVLDLHCDAEARLHMYALSPQQDVAMQLASLLGAEAVLLATESGGEPFDEACSRPWLQLQQRFPGRPIELACFAATVEFRGEADTSHALAQQDAQALLDFLTLRGVLGGPAPALPAARCEPTPLSGSEPITAPSGGVVVFHARPGQRVEAGALIADVVDPHTGTVTSLHCKSAGLLYACCGSRWAHGGKRLAKIAGTSLARTGKLLSP